MSKKHLVRIYMDPYSIPMLQQALHFCKHGKEQDTTSFTIWDRCSLLTGASLSPNHIHFKQEVHITPPAIIDAIVELRAKYRELEVEVHSNQGYADAGLAPLLNMLHFLDIPVSHIHLYEDGTMEYDALMWFEHVWNNIRNNTLKHHQKNFYEKMYDLCGLISEGENIWRDYIYNKNQYLNPLKFDPMWKGWFARYAWHRLYPTTYHMLRPDILVKLPDLKPLSDEISPYVQKTDWSDFQRLTLEQQDLFLKIIGTSREYLDDFVKNNPDPIIFTGTAFNVDVNRTDIAHAQVRMHLDFLKNIKKPKTPVSIPGKYSLCFKGHPGGGFVNAPLLKLAKGVGEFNSRLPLEILWMYGVKVKAICGMVSSAYLTIPDGMVTFIAIPPKTRGSREKILNSDGMIKLMLRLGVVNESQIVLYQDLFHKGKYHIPAWDEYNYEQLDTARHIGAVRSGNKISPPDKHLQVGFYIGSVEHYQSAEKTIDSLLRLRHSIVLVIDEQSPDFQAVCAFFGTLTRKDLAAYTIEAVRNANHRFDVIAVPSNRTDLAPLGYGLAEYGDTGVLGTMPTTLAAIFAQQQRYRIVVHKRDTK